VFELGISKNNSSSFAFANVPALPLLSVKFIVEFVKFQKKKVIFIMDWGFHQQVKN